MHLTAPAGPGQGAPGLADKFLEDSGFEQQQGDRQELLQSVVDRMIALAQLAEGLKTDSSEAEALEISRELKGEINKTQKMAQPLLGSKDPQIAEKTFKVM